MSSGDHQTDTVVKKEIYEEISLPRLWMIDPRYDNVEVYHGGPARTWPLRRNPRSSREVLTEALLPGFQYTIAELFKM